MAFLLLNIWRLSDVHNLLQCLSGAYSHCIVKRITILDAIRIMPMAIGCFKALII